MSDATVSRDIVVKVLRRGGVDVSREGNNFTLAKAGASIQTIVLPSHVGRKMLFRFQFKYGIPIHWFFHPEMIPNPSSTKETLQ